MSLTIVGVPLQAAGEPPAIKGEEQHRVGLKTRLAYDDEPQTSSQIIAPVLHYTYRLNDWLRAQAQWGFSWLSTEAESGSTANTWRSSNLLLGAGIERSNEQGAWESARLSVALPLASLPDRSVDRARARAAYAYALAAYGYYDAWLWAPEQLGLAAQGALFYPLTDSSAKEYLAVAGELGLGGTIPLGDPDIIGQIFSQAAGEFTLGGSFRAGPRLQLVWMPLSEFGTFQTSLGIRGSAEFSSRVHLKALAMTMPGGPASHVFSQWSLGLNGSFLW